MQVGLILKFQNRVSTMTRSFNYISNVYHVDRVQMYVNVSSKKPRVGTHSSDIFAVFSSGFFLAAGSRHLGYVISRGVIVEL